MKLRSLLGVLALWSGIPGFASSQEPGGRPQVLVLGVWHMSNYTDDGQDILSPERQAELAEVMVVLQRFQPTRIALEAPFYRGDDLARAYADYVERGRDLTRNERQQIGFRLARRLGHETVYAIDADGDFPLPRLQDYVQARDQADAYEAMRSEWGDSLQARHAYFASHTLLETLLYMNSDAYVAQIMAHDYELAHFGEPWNWAGPDLLAAWFRRNIRIYGNIVHLAESPGERVLVIIGGGHLAWLRHNFDNDPAIRLRKLAEFNH